jgi:hypothetical protein
MARIKIKDLPKGMKLSKKEMIKVFGGFSSSIYYSDVSKSESIVDAYREHLAQQQKNITDMQKQQQQTVDSIINLIY